MASFLAAEPCQNIGSPRLAGDYIHVGWNLARRVTRTGYWQLLNTTHHRFYELIIFNIYCDFTHIYINYIHYIYISYSRKRWSMNLNGEYAETRPTSFSSWSGLSNSNRSTCIFSPPFSDLPLSQRNLSAWLPSVVHYLL